MQSKLFLATATRHMERICWTKMKKATESKFDAYQAVTDAIIAKLESGVCPWRKSWRSLSGQMPQNAISKKTYGGMNLMLLGFNDYVDHRWVTFLQAKDLGGSVRKGEKSSLICYYQNGWNKNVKDAETGETRKEFIAMPVLTVSRVFNVSQCEGLKLEPLQVSMDLRTDAEKIGEAEAIVQGYLSCDGPKLADGYNSAYYTASDDKVCMPSLAQFEGDAAYYQTLFHELGHSTGHASRLARKGIVGSHRFGSSEYSQEELVAELSAAFLMNEAGLESPEATEQSAAYLDSWIRALKGDSKLLVRASSAASKAAKLILGDLEVAL